MWNDKLSCSTIVTNEPVILDDNLSLISTFISDDTLTFVDYNGAEANERGLLLFNNGTVCGNGFKSTSAKAVCEKMGYYGVVGSWHNFETTRLWPVRHTYAIAVTNLDCPDGTWASCSYSKKTRSYCNHYSDVYLDCGSEFCCAFLLAPTTALIRRPKYFNLIRDRFRITYGHWNNKHLNRLQI